MQIPATVAAVAIAKPLQRADIENERASSGAGGEMASSSEHNEAADLSAANGEINLHGRRVLVVEDDPMVAMLLMDMLEAIGCEVVAVASRLEDALEKAQRLSFDLAILDVNLEGANTFHVAELLAKRGIGFIFATGYGDVHLPADLANAPVLQKPFGERDVARALRRAVQSA
jgi:CheY-like chemotaxis protein